MRVRARPIAMWSAAFIALALSVAGAQAGKLKTLASFCAERGCTDGSFPFHNLVADSKGNFYGTANGGNSELGVVFQLAPNADKTAWTLNTVHAFCITCKEGVEPFGKLIIDERGNLYGTTYEGGTQGLGTVYELMPNAHRTKWAFKTIHNFELTDGDSRAGLTYRSAASGVPFDGTSPLYGTAVVGGVHGQGTVYQLTRSGDSWSETTLYDFCALTDCADGANPMGVIADGGGHLFGTAFGGANGGGVLFELVKKNGVWRETVLHNFCTLQTCADGVAPEEPLLIDGSGTLYGAAADENGKNGVVFRLAPNGEDSQYDILYSFCSLADCRDGSAPHAELTMDSSGDLYGTAAGGGRYDGGTIFKLHGSSLDVLHSFCAKPACADGQEPYGGVVLDASGRLYGTTGHGGAHDHGMVFELTP